MQPNVDQAAKWSPERRQQVLDELITLSDSKTGPDTLGALSFSQIIWPETALPFFLTEEPEALARIADLLPPGTMLPPARRVSSPPTTAVTPGAAITTRCSWSMTQERSVPPMTRYTSSRSANTCRSRIFSAN